MKPRVPSKAGFAMPLVLTMVAILTLTFAVALVSLKNLKEQTVLAKTGADFEADQMTAEARFTYLALTEPFGAASIDIGAPRQQATGGVTVAPDAQVFMDARPYRWRRIADDTSPAYVVSLQDEAGLFNIWQADASQLARLFEWAGLSEGDAADFADEIIEYKQVPTEHPAMRRAAELYKLESAPALLTEKVWRKLTSLTTLYPDNRAFNMNTAPAEVLSLFFDLSDVQAQEAIEKREGGQILTTTGDIGAVVTDNRNYAFSGGRVRFSFTDPQTGLTRRSTLVLTPNSAIRPFWIENVQTLAPPPEKTPTDELDDFPEIPDLAS